MEETPGRASLEKLGCRTPPQLHAGGVGRQQQHRVNTESILERITARDDLRYRDHTSSALQQMSDDITRTTNEHRRKTWRQFVKTLGHMTDPSKLWRTIKAIDGKSPPKDENEARTFDDSHVFFPKQISTYFNRQFTTSKLGIHTSSHETRLVSIEKLSGNH